MSITIQTTDGPVTVWDNEIATLSLDFPGVDVPKQLQRLADWISTGKGTKPASQSLNASIKGWLRKARPEAPAKEKPEYLSVQAALEECIARGLVPPDFKPVGDSEAAQRTSLRAKATQGFYRQNPEYEGESAPPAQRPLWSDEPQSQVA